MIDEKQFGTVEDDDMAWAESEYHAVREAACLIEVAWATHRLKDEPDQRVRDIVLLMAQWGEAYRQEHGKRHPHCNRAINTVFNVRRHMPSHFREWSYDPFSLTDYEWLAFQNCGKKTLSFIRQFIPAP